MDRFQITDDMLGPFLPFIRREDITDIDWNGRNLWVKDITCQRRKIVDSQITSQLTDEFIESFAISIGNMAGKNLNPIDNVIEAETPELRITVLHNTIALTGYCICIRKTPPIQRITPAHAIDNNYCEEEVLHLLANCVKAKINMVFCGEPGSGKTECSKFLTHFIPAEEKVVTIEDTLELRYSTINPDKDCVELKVNEYFSYNDALKEVLRMNPNRTMLSEARSTEVKELLECWTTGITGFTTLHTDDLRKIPDRILNMMPTRQDAERLINDVYIAQIMGVLIDVRFNPEKEKLERYIREVGFFSRENERNRFFPIVIDAKLQEHEVPDSLQKVMDKSKIQNPFYNEQLGEMITTERKEQRE